MLAKRSISYLSFSPIILRPFRAFGQEGDFYLRFHRRLFIFSHIHDCSVKPIAGLWILTNLPAGDCRGVEMKNQVLPCGTRSPKVIPIQ